ncbi:sex-determining region Y protein-like [Schistocerca americana]|uniref:sex-determining region Y protein-like n=1 Tax=Schistocerca americana TaxID=7009 RepID=UPI001F4F67A7|nr:sex-determining region Y protein-like [Schistocerca americana]
MLTHVSVVAVDSVRVCELSPSTVEFTTRQKIPRPPNAFMIFANEWRKKLAVNYPRESNKDISVRLGAMWKSMTKADKDQYFAQARQVDAEHKRKYPNKLIIYTAFVDA